MPCILNMSPCLQVSVEQKPAILSIVAKRPCLPQVRPKRAAVSSYKLPPCCLQFMFDLTLPVCAATG